MNNSCLDRVRCVLFLVNIVMFICFGTLLSFCIYVLSGGPKVYYSELSIVIAILAFLIFSTLIGCCGSGQKNRCMLASHITIMLLFLVANVGGIVYLFGFYGVSSGSPADLQNGELELLTRGLYMSITSMVGLR